MNQRILVWDVPTRVFHWTLALSFVGAFLTAESERYRDIHVMLGYTLLGLIAFRLLWGLFGTHYARFRSFMFKPGEIIAYLSSLLKGKPVHYVGHNPAGSLAIWLLLALGISSGATGLMAFQDFGGDAAEELHELLSDAMLLVVLIHLVGVAVSSVLHRENLVRAMITGFKQAPGQEPPATATTNGGIRRPYAWLGVIMLTAVVAFWAGYPAAGLPGTDAQAAHGEEHDDD
ncbi:MAG: cytochrome B [Gallionellales bacterium RIFCSPLOWO2_12_FULL_59_22]|nr:MAG: cytochrome B [Gallionellales bacterium RIFCSPLOWO2_02_FULL_59_110]OGT05014.1 MAG: cytochrome B [Gallionellales bacterium RIFCSPLOWO2_02_58_13]OGT12555.1 MAG: cytochrome B [Gallionellales bacterium RIFCSPLOWO2_12_FULL_59_22]